MESPYYISQCPSLGHQCSTAYSYLTTNRKWLRYGIAIKQIITATTKSCCGSIPTWKRCSQYTGIPCFIVLCFIAHFYKFRVGGNPASNKSISAIFPIAFAHFVCHILVVLAVLLTFSLFCYGDL